MAKRTFQISVKYAVDRFIGIVAVILLAPLFALIALAVKLEDWGPAMFVQERPGLDGVPFPTFKFRSMFVNADEMVDAQGRPTGNRITRVGRFLRFTSLDELPQLLNVARGEMCIVGPRPPMMIHLRRYDQRQMERFRMKPGITGLAQVSGRNQLKWSKRIAYDNEYIDSYSLWNDVVILVKTVRVVLFREGIVVDRNPGQVDDLLPVRPEGEPPPPPQVYAS